MAWSPVAMPLQRERRFISAATSGASGPAVDAHVEAAPRTAPAASACSTAAVRVGRQPRVGMQEQQHVARGLRGAGVHLPRAAAAGRRARGRRQGRRAPRCRRVLPPSATITSAPRCAQRRAAACERMRSRRRPRPAPASTMDAGLSATSVASAGVPSWHARRRWASRLARRAAPVPARRRSCCPGRPCSRSSGRRCGSSSPCRVVQQQVAQVGPRRAAQRARAGPASG